MLTGMHGHASRPRHLESELPRSEAFIFDYKEQSAKSDLELTDRDVLFLVLCVGET